MFLLLLLFAFNSIASLSFFTSHLAASEEKIGNLGTSEETALEEPLKATHISTSLSAPLMISAAPEAGYFYRMNSTATNVKGVYAKSVNYRGALELFNDTTPPIKDYVFDQTSTEKTTWLGLVFFGVWSVKSNSEGMVISVPVRLLEAGKMARNARCIWKTGHDNEETLDVNGEKFAHLPSYDDPTESAFINYIQRTETQSALWEYFLEVSDEKITGSDRKLCCIGFNCFSTNDTCDEGLERLLNLKQHRLANIPPQQSDGLAYAIEALTFPVPFFINYKAKNFCNLQYENGSKKTASLLFTPRCYSFLRLGGNIGQYHISNFVDPEEEKIDHHEKIEVQANEEFNHIILMIGNGDSVKVSTRLT